MLKNKNIKKTRSGFCTGKSFLSSPFFFLFPFSFLLFPLSSPLSSAILTVKQDGTGDYTIIQEAIDAAAMHDTVLVWPGTYYENLHIDTKPITLASHYLSTGEKQYIYQTIIDGSTIKNSVIVADIFPTGVTGTICGFSIQNGDARYNEINFPIDYNGVGGGILLYKANMVINNCVIKENLAYAVGGGVAAWYSIVQLSGNSICNNNSYLFGGGVWAGGGDYIEFDTLQLNSIYLNHSICGNDICKHFETVCTEFRIDTFTVAKDHGYCLYNYHSTNATPVFDYTLLVNHPVIDQFDADVYVSPLGDNDNSGLKPDEPLRNIWYAMTKINPDTNNQRTVHVMPGTYSPSTNGEIYPINARSNSCLLGEDMNSCILDAEQSWFHYSTHSRSYALALKKLKFINGNSFINDYHTYSGSIHFNWSCYNIALQDIMIENCIGLDAGGAKILTLDWISLENIHTFNNFGGFSLRTLYTDQPIRYAIMARNCSFLNNSYYLDMYGSGGGYFCGDVYTQIDPLVSTTSGMLVCNNESRDFWGGLEHLSTFAVTGGINNITNVTVADNVNKDDLPGAYSTWENMTSRVYNSIFYGNEHPSIILSVQPPLENPGELYIDYSLIEQGLDDIWNQQNFNILHYGVNNIEGNPLFTRTGDHPYQLQANSPCINTGTPMYEEGMEPPYIKEENGKYILYTHELDTIHLPATDLAGNPRIAYGRIDMGAYEFADTTVNIMKRPPKYLGGKIKVMPNPFRHSTAIEFTLLKEGRCVVKIHNLNGHLIKTLLDTFTVPGNFNMRWHADDDYGNKIPSGHYIINVIFEGENVGSVKVRRW
ncbi:MAG: hypothetical protein B6D64_08895 [Bacteroidetes bacterium 4484_276]|nr:MAG: hypothetical protein B6D64_08895 [Bacteroidetes bacterium 4484_276]OYT14154.1 MAG: hypothetical protein B6I19_01360 [Bacteroidetes bacterium 4572_114]